MSCRLVALDVDARDAVRLGLFWADLLGRGLVTDGDAQLMPGSATKVGLRFVPSDSRPHNPERVHLHVTSEGHEQQAVVQAALGFGASHVDVGQRPDEPHVVLADPEGSAFCVIEPGNGFLAGCGLLGELACDGTRDVGVFWAEALGWPLVWDADGETAVQSMAGGTKISWGGPPVAPKQGRNRQRLRLVTADLDAEVARLVSLGASVLSRGDGAVELADPDGNELSLLVG